MSGMEILTLANVIVVAFGVAASWRAAVVAGRSAKAAERDREETSRDRERTLQLRNEANLSRDEANATRQKIEQHLGKIAERSGEDPVERDLAVVDWLIQRVEWQISELAPKVQQTPQIKGTARYHWMDQHKEAIEQKIALTSRQTQARLNEMFEGVLAHQKGRAGLELLSGPLKDFEETLVELKEMHSELEKRRKIAGEDI